jgi:F0F1-type ATP synthase membrane subunit b/b'
MTTNTLNEIQKIEKQAQEIVAQARQKMENLITQANQTGQKNLDSVQGQVTTQIEEIIEKAKKEIQKIKVKNNHDLTKELDKLNKIDNKTIEQASKIITDSIVK